MWPLAQNCPCKADSAPALKQDPLQRLTAVPSHVSCLPQLITSSFLLPFFLVLFPSSPPVPPSLVPFLVFLAFSSSILTYLPVSSPSSSRPFLPCPSSFFSLFFLTSLFPSILLRPLYFLLSVIPFRLTAAPPYHTCRCVFCARGQARKGL